MLTGKRLVWLGALLGAVLLLAACGAPAAPTPTPEPTLDPVAPVIEIRLSEFKFNPDRIVLRVGQQVTFHVVNLGATDHELMIGRNPLRDDMGMLGDGFEHDFFAMSDVQVEGDATVMGMPGDEMAMEDGDIPMEEPTQEGDTAMGDEMSDMAGEMANGFMAMFEPQQEATITFTVTEAMLGTWTMGCFEISQDVVHYDEGMAGVLYVLSQ